MFPWGTGVTTQTSSFNFSGLCLFYFPSIKKRITHLVGKFCECTKCHQTVHLERECFYLNKENCVAQLVEYLASMQKAWGSVPSTV